MKKLQDLLYAHLAKMRHLGDQALYTYVLMMAVAIISLTVHVAFSIFFAVAGCMPLAISHVCGVLVFILCSLCLVRGYFDFAGAALCVMILFSSLATIYTIGGDNFSIFYQLLVLVILMVVPFKHRAIPIVFCCLMPFIMIGSYLYDINFAALYDIGLYNNILSVCNILVAFSGMVILFSLNRMVTGFVDSFIHRRMVELEGQAYIDPLTQLYNRRYAEEYFNQMCGTPQNAATCAAMLDIDDFKVINDTWGHETGDKVLKRLSGLLLDNTRKTDVVARWGGEEFLIIINNTELANATQMLDKIRRIIQDTPVPHDGGTLRFTVTIGVDVLDPHNVQNSLEACDQKLYMGKRQGKNQVV